MAACHFLFSLFPFHFLRQCHGWRKRTQSRQALEYFFSSCTITVENIFGFQIVQLGNIPYTRWTSEQNAICLFIYLFCFSLVTLYLKFIPKKQKKKKKVHLLSLLHIFVKLIKNYQCFVNLLAWLLRAIGRVREIATSQKCFSFFKIYGLALWIAGKCFYGKYLVKEWRDVSQWKLIAKKKEIRKVIRRLENCHVFDIGQ